MDVTGPAAQSVMTIDTAADGVTVVRITGEVDLSNVEPLRAQLGAAIEQARGPIAFDLDELEFIDSSGLALLLLAAGSPHGVEVRRASEIVRRVIDIAGLNDILGLR